MKAGTLFTGIGGPEIAFDALGVETIWQSEIDPYASTVLAARFPGVPNLGDVKRINNPEHVDLMALGFPCQDISNAGLRAGISGSRSSLWAEGLRIISQVKPRLVFIENVAALLNRGLDVVLADLDAIGYSAEWDCIPAAAVGAPHLRDRIWLVAYPDDLGPLYVFAEKDTRERAVGNLYHQPSKFPRAGRMEQGALYEREPVAKRKTKRLNPGSAWVGVELTREHGWWHTRPTLPGEQPSESRALAPVALIPTPTVADSRNTRNATASRSEGSKGHSGTTLCDYVAMFPTPVASDRKGPGPLDRRPVGDDDLCTRIARIERGLWPTPTRSDGVGGPGSSGRDGGDNLRTRVARTQQGSLNPSWVEWLMGFPLGWTDLDIDHAGQASTWNLEPIYVPRVAEGVEKRRERLTCVGNALVPQVMHWVAKRALERIA